MRLVTPEYKESALNEAIEAGARSVMTDGFARWEEMAVEPDGHVRYFFRVPATAQELDRLQPGEQGGYTVSELAAIELDDVCYRGVYRASGMRPRRSFIPCGIDEIMKGDKLALSSKERTQLTRSFRIVELGDVSAVLLGQTPTTFSPPVPFTENLQPVIIGNHC